MDKHHHPQSSLPTLTRSEVRGMELGEEIKTWKEIAGSEARMTLMKTMIKHHLAFSDLEEFGVEFNNNQHPDIIWSLGETES